MSENAITPDVWTPAPGEAPIPTDTAAAAPVTAPTVELPTEPQTAAPAAPVTPAITAPPGGKVITLPSGFQVGIRNAKAIRNKERRFIYEGLDLDGAPGGAPSSGQAVAMGFAMTDRIVALIIDSWDVRAVDDALEPYGDVLPIPKLDPAGLDNMPMEDASVLEAEAEAARKILMPDFSPSPDKQSPTSPSAG